MARARVKPTPELKRAIERFLSLIYRYECGTKRSFFGYRAIRRSGYSWWAGTKYIHLNPLSGSLIVLPDGRVFRAKRYRSPNWDACLGSIYDLLDERKWGKSIFIQTIRVGTIYGDVIPAHRLVVASDRKCRICGRRDGVKNTLNGDLCRYHLAADKRHMNEVRQLGHMPRFEGRPILRNEDYVLEPTPAHA